MKRELLALRRLLATLLVALSVSVRPSEALRSGRWLQAQIYSILGDDGWQTVDTQAGSCPTNPLDPCDFYFDGYSSSVPVFTLPTTGGDAQVSSAILRDKYGNAVEVDSTGTNQFLCVNSSTSFASAGNQFYLNGNPSTLIRRTVNSPLIPFDLDGICVKLPIDAAFIASNSSSVNLNPGDENSNFYPESRRCVVFTTSPGVGSCQAAAVPPVSPAPPPAAPPPVFPEVPPSPAPTSSGSCPANPFDYCDFYFDGYSSSIPIFTLPSGTSDQQVSSAVVRDKFNNAIEVDSTGANQYLCYSATDGSSSSPLPTSGQTQFYLNGQPSLLLMRTVNYPVTLSALTGACVLLPIAAAQVPANNTVINLNYGDGNSVYPDSRRCIVFAVSPGPICQATSSPPTPAVLPPAPAPVALPPVIATPPAAAQCPCPYSSPTQDCDFFFEKHENDIPTYNLGGGGDHAISDAVMWFSVPGTGTQLYLEVDSTGQATSACSGSENSSFGDQFYITNLSGQGYVFVRTFQSDPGVGYFAGTCVKVPILAAQVDYQNNTVINLNPGDGNTDFPEARRCIVFQTAL